MVHLTIQPMSPRYIGASLEVSTAARHLKAFAYAETRLIEAVAGWLPYIPHAELKIELAYQLYEDAQHIDAMRQRLPELGDFSGVVEAPHENVARFFNELTNTEDVTEQLVGLFWVLRPALQQHYRDHLARTDTVADAPTARLLNIALADHARFTAWSDHLLRQITRSPDELSKAQQWTDHLQQLLTAAGGITGDNPREDVPVVVPRNAGEGKRFRMDMPRRDERFVIAAYERREGRAATDVWDQESFLKYMFMMVEGELEATEACARTLFDYPDAPWEFRLILARQLWDEARHAELSLQRFFELGGRLDMLPVRETFPLYFGPVANRELTYRLAHLNQVVEGWVTDDFAMMVDICRQLGDTRSQRLFEQLIVDEWLHLKIGADWIPRLAQQPEQRAAVIAYRHHVEDELYKGLEKAAQETAKRF